MLGAKVAVLSLLWLCLFAPSLHAASVSATRVDEMLAVLLEEAAATESQTTRAVATTTIDEDTHPVLLERRAAVEMMGPQCSESRYCPIKNGICCEGGQGCCPDRCTSGGSNPQCGVSTMERSLAMARAKMKEEGHKQLAAEATKKSKTEQGQKNKMEERQKSAKENNKKHKEISAEAEAKALKQRREAEAKGTARAEQRSKVAKEKKHKSTEKQKKEQRKKAERRKKSREKAEESKRKDQDRKKEAARKEQRKKKEKSTKERQSKSRKAERDRKAKAKERNAKTLERRKKAEIKTIRSGNFRPHRNHLLAPSAVLKNRGMFTYYFWLRPEGTSRTWSGLMHKGATNSQRSPAIWFYPGRTRLHIRSATRGSFNNGLDPHHNLAVWKWVHVAIRHKKGELSVFYNGKMVGKRAVPAPVQNHAPLYGTQKWYPAAFCTMSDLKFQPSFGSTKRISQIYKQRKFKKHKNHVKVVRSSNFKPKRRQLLLRHSAIRKNHQYSWMFWVKPNNINRGWSGLIHKGNHNTHRNPAFWFYPSRTRLHIRSGTRASWNDGGDPGRHLPMHRWTHVALAHREGSLKVWFNGNLVLSRKTYMPKENNGHLWGCGPWYPPTDSWMADLIHVDGFLTTRDVKARYRKRKFSYVKPKLTMLRAGRWAPRRYRKLSDGRNIPASSAITYMFWLYRSGTTSGWSNIIHKGHNNHQRAPAVWFYPRRARLHIRSTTRRHWNDGGDPHRNIRYRRWTHVAITHRHGEYRVYYDGNVVYHANLLAPVGNNGPLWSADPWHQNPRCLIADVRFYNGAVKNSEVRKVFKKKKMGGHRR